jgi:hypothetical protein
MIITHYAHRLSANHDIDLIRTRARERGPLWDAVPELYFKGFLLREKDVTAQLRTTIRRCICGNKMRHSATSWLAAATSP